MSEELIKLETGDAIEKLEHESIYHVDKNDINESTFESIKSEAEMWENLSHLKTPQQEVYFREGSDGKTYEHIKEFYTIRMLNRCFPGWWQEKMETKYYPEVRTFITTGYLMIQYMTKNGIKTRSIYALGSSFVLPRKDNPTMPTQPDDKAKESLTEWFKIAGKRLGFGLDIYEQTIPDEYIADYEQRVSFWGEREYIDELASKCRSKVLFKEKILDYMPTLAQSIEMAELAEHIPESKRDKFWADWQKHSKESAQTLINRIKETINSQKGEPNG